jgi:hypothetical protein
MGFVYRKSVKAELFRSNLSKSGAGLSAGVPGILSRLDRDHPFNLAEAKESMAGAKIA